jgi:3-keto steroid reductase
LWTSSIEASHEYYGQEDWQLIKAEYSYGASKYQIELIATQLDSYAINELPQSTGVKVRHVITQPGVNSTGMSSRYINFLANFAMEIIFYLVRP